MVEWPLVLGRGLLPWAFCPPTITVKGTLGHPSKGLGIHSGGAWGKAEVPWLGVL